MVDRVYVFDLDDTLYLERDYVRSGFMHVERVAKDLYGLDGVGHHAWSLFEQGVRGETFDITAEFFSLHPGSSRDLVAEYRDHNPSISLQPDSEWFINNLPVDSIGTGMITDGYAEGQWRKIRALGLDGVLDNLVVTGDRGLDWTKPSDRAFRLIESKFPQPEVQFVYFGDNPKKDFQTPLRLGWHVVRVRRPLGLHYAADDAGTVHETISMFPNGDENRRQVIFAHLSSAEGWSR